MEPNKTITVKGKTVHLYNFDRFGCCEHVVYDFDPFDPTDVNYSATRAIHDSGVKLASVSCGIAIEPLRGEYATRSRRGEKIGLPKSELQEGSACLFFVRPETIDTLIEALKKCKGTLTKKIKAEKTAEYRRKFCGQVVKLSDYKTEHPEVVKRVTGQQEKQIQAAVDAEMRREAFVASFEPSPPAARGSEPKPEKQSRPAMRYAKSEWGLRVKIFSQQHGITLKAIANASGVSYNTLLQVIIGKTHGENVSVVEKVEAFMAEHAAQNEPNLITQPQPHPKEEETPGDQSSQET